MHFHTPGPTAKSPFLPARTFARLRNGGLPTYPLHTDSISPQLMESLARTFQSSSY